MSNNITELREAMENYTLDYSINEIPQDYYETMLNTWNDMNSHGYEWGKDNAAAALLYAAVIDGIIQRSQITTQGYNAINWAESFLLDLDRTQACA